MLRVRGGMQAAGDGGADGVAPADPQETSQHGAEPVWARPYTPTDDYYSWTHTGRLEWRMMEERGCEGEGQEGEELVSPGSSLCRPMVACEGRACGRLVSAAYVGGDRGDPGGMSQPWREAYCMECVVWCFACGHPVTEAVAVMCDLSEPLCSRCADRCARGVLDDCVQERARVAFAHRMRWDWGAGWQDMGATRVWQLAMRSRIRHQHADARVYAWMREVEEVD